MVHTFWKGCVHGLIFPFLIRTLLDLSKRLGQCCSIYSFKDSAQSYFYANVFLQMQITAEVSIILKNVTTEVMLPLF